MGFFATKHSVESQANLKVQSTINIYKMTKEVPCFKSNCFKGYRCEVFIFSKFSFVLKLDLALTYMWGESDYTPAEVYKISYKN